MSSLLPEFFRRLDEEPDAVFYRSPRFGAGTHLDAAAEAAALQVYDELLPQGPTLDLMASCCSHLPERLTDVTGIGLNAEELAVNPRLTERHVFDLNRGTHLPIASGRFSGVVCTASVQYLIDPVHTFTEVARVLRPGAPLVVTFSTRMFPSKAVLGWRCADDAARLRLVRSYFDNSGSFGATSCRRFLPESGDRLYSVWSHKA